MNVEEHFYADDPNAGPLDVRTTLAGVAYYFLGNGHLTAAVQICPAGEGTPIGLLLMSPENFGPKRNALTFDAATGIKNTMLHVRLDGERTLTPASKQMQVKWIEVEETPAVAVAWEEFGVKIVERFYFPTRTLPSLIRQIRITNTTLSKISLQISTGLPSAQLERSLSLTAGQVQELEIAYTALRQNGKLQAEMSWASEAGIDASAKSYWRQTCAFHCDHQVLNHLFAAAKYQLPANVAASGKADASVWQYNHEWVRDSAMIATGLILTGQFETARTMLDHLLTECVTPEGDTVDSGKTRPPAEVELDQNGELLHALRIYVDWTDDWEVVKAHWQTIRAISDFPLRPIFRHPKVSLLHNQREFWERHTLHGIADGMELMYQFYVAVGLTDAAYLAEHFGFAHDASRWADFADQLKTAMLDDPQFGLIDNGHFIKRRKLDGSMQLETRLPEQAGLPAGIPLAEAGVHLLNPDSSAALPIAMEFIEPQSALARNTMAQLEQLWNQRWENGGYGRYHISSEPDSPGPWPFPSLFIARAYFEMGEDEKVWRILKWLSTLPGAKAGTWFEFYGPRPVPPYPQIGIPPWTWAEMIMLFVHHLLGIRPSQDHLLLRPRMLAGMKEMTATIFVRKSRVKVAIRRVAKGEQPGVRVNSEPHAYSSTGVKIKWQDELNVEVIQPGA